MRLPEKFVETWAHEPEWLETIPGLLRELADDWGLELEDPIDTPYSLVVPAGDAVLKLNAPSHFEADHEADALECWDGQGAVRLLARDDERRAFLMERCVPGTTLWTIRGPRRGGRARGRDGASATPPTARRRGASVPAPGGRGRPLGGRAARPVRADWRAVRALAPRLRPRRLRRRRPLRLLLS